MLESKVVDYDKMQTIKKLVINNESIEKNLYDTIYVNQISIDKEFYNIFNTTFLKAKKVLSISYKSSLLRYDTKKIVKELITKLLDNNVYLPYSFIVKTKKLLPQEIDIIEDNIDYKMIAKKNNFNNLTISFSSYKK